MDFGILVKQENEREGEAKEEPEKQLMPCKEHKHRLVCFFLLVRKLGRALRGLDSYPTLDLPQGPLID